MAIMPSSLPLTRLFAFLEKRSEVMGPWNKETAYYCETNRGN